MEVHVPHDVILKPKPKRSTMEVHVSHDVILNHILPRVPVKTAGRFRCVSKEWHSLLTWDMLRNMHIDHHQINSSKLLVISASETSFEFSTIDCEALPSDKGLIPTSRPLPPFEGITLRYICIIASYHGLVCLGILYRNGHVYSHIILWNPLTNEYKRLSKSNSHMECNDIEYRSSTFGFYYSSCEDDYKLLLVKDDYESNFYIYSLKSDSWRKVEVFPHASILRNARWRQGTYLNEKLYFLRQRENERLGSIIRFDTKTEQFSAIATPRVLNNRYPYNCSATIMVQSGHLHVCVKYNTEKIDKLMNMKFERTYIKLWKLDEYENWKEVVNYKLRPHDCTFRYLDPLHFMKNGNMIGDLGPCLYRVDLKKREINYLCDDYELYPAIGRMNDWYGQVRYTETIVSPNKYKK